MSQNMQFVSCNVTKCPFNSSKQCRSPFLMIDTNGRCVIKDNGPYEDRSPTENYVDIRECRCKSCNHWELDDYTNIGKCGLGENLHFVLRNLISDNKEVAVCNAFDKQVETPPNFQTVV